MISESGFLCCSLSGYVFSYLFSLIISNFWRGICSSLIMCNLGGLQRVMTVDDATTVGNKLRERQGG